MIYEIATGEIRNMDLSDVPEHKRDLWLPVEDEGSGQSVSIVVEQDKVRRIFSTPVPQSVTPYQARRALSLAGLRSQVEAAVEAAGQDVQDAWQYGVSVERNSPMIITLGAALGLSSEQIDQLFISASQVS